MGTDARKLQLAGAFGVTGLPHAPRTWQRVERELARFATRWRVQEREACLAEQVDDSDAELVLLDAWLRKHGE